MKETRTWTDQWKDSHDVEDYCRHEWCRIHWWPDFNLGRIRYPIEVYRKREGRWVTIDIYHGPAAYFPKKPTPDQWREMRAVCPHDPPQLTCDRCRRHEFRALQV